MFEMEVEHMEEDVADYMRSLKLKGKRPKEGPSVDRQSKKRFELFPSPNGRPPSPRQRIKFVNWRQTPDKVELVLRLPISSSSSTCLVFQEGERLVVKTTRGCHWSCNLHEATPERGTAAFVVRGLLKVVLSKPAGGTHWPCYRRRSSVQALVSDDSSDEDDKDMSIDEDDDEEEEEEEAEELQPFGGVTITMLEVADGKVRLFVHVGGMSREVRPKFSFGQNEVVLTVFCRRSPSDRGRWCCIDIGFKEGILPHGSVRPLASAMNHLHDDDVLEIVVVKQEQWIWNPSSAFVKSVKELDPHPCVKTSSDCCRPLVEEWTTVVNGQKPVVDENDFPIIDKNDFPIVDKNDFPVVVDNGVSKLSREFEGSSLSPVKTLSAGRLCQSMTHAPSTSPGFVGLENLGNTCFLNCIVQVLANTPELKNYFIGESYLNDLNVTNCLGMGGRLANAFADVVRALWSGRARTFCPYTLKDLIGQKQSRFLGFLQHDAEELMEVLLDGLHEDLNRVGKRPAASVVVADEEDQSRLELEELASASWSKHESRNNSFIVDLFQGQYHSRLTCPECGKVSVTFDPFSVVQVPLPTRKVKFEVIVVPRRPRINGPSRHQIIMEADSNVGQLLTRVCDTDRTLKMANLRVLEICKSQVKRMIYRNSKLSNSGTILICEVDTCEEAGEPTVELVVQQRTVLPLPGPYMASCRSCRGSEGRLRRCTRCYRVAYCNQKCQREDWTRHKPECGLTGDSIGCPFVIGLPLYSTTYERLASLAEEFASLSVGVYNSSKTSGGSPVKPEVGEGDGPSVQAREENSDRDSSGDAEGRLSRKKSADEEAKADQGEAPSTRHDSPNLPIRPPFDLIPCPGPSTYGQVCQGLAANGTPIPDQGEKPLDLGSMKFLMLLWKNCYDVGKQLAVHNKEIVEDVKNDESSKDTEKLETQLGDCFRLFTEPEVLSQEQFWHCSRCSSMCQATKEISLWKPPRVLIIHLKRFCSESFLFREKIEDLVEFPITGFDISPYMKRRKRRVDSSSSSSSFPSTTYDLYGVINHQGGMLGGHYTSLARYQGDESTEPIGWRRFDDSHVTACPESKVVTSSAYVLFYRQRDAGLPDGPCPPSSLPSLHPGAVNFADPEGHLDVNSNPVC